VYIQARGARQDGAARGGLEINRENAGLRGLHQAGNIKRMRDQAMSDEKKTETKATTDNTTTSKNLAADSRSEFNTPSIMASGDGFDSVAGGDKRSMIMGVRLKFTNAAEFLTDDDTAIAPGRRFVAVQLVPLCQKWVHGQRHPETIELAPNEKFPDIKQLNEAAPPEEWREDKFNPGKMKGPYENTWLVRLLDLETGIGFTFVTSTFGGFRAVEALRDATQLKRALEGKKLYPVVTLADVDWRTRYGSRRRPHFNILGYRPMGPGTRGASLIPESTPPKSEKFDSNEDPFDGPAGMIDINDEIKY
jgi:hypothetical protein